MLAGDGGRDLTFLLQILQEGKSAYFKTNNNSVKNN